MHLPLLKLNLNCFLGILSLNQTLLFHYTFAFLQRVVVQVLNLNCIFTTHTDNLDIPVSQHIIPSSKDNAPAKTNAAYSPTLNPAVATQFSMAYNKT